MLIVAVVTTVAICELHFLSPFHQRGQCSSPGSPRNNSCEIKRLWQAQAHQWASWLNRDFKPGLSNQSPTLIAMIYTLIIQCINAFLSCPPMPMLSVSIPCLNESRRLGKWPKSLPPGQRRFKVMSKEVSSAIHYWYILFFSSMLASKSSGYVHVNPSFIYVLWLA